MPGELYQVQAGRYADALERITGLGDALALTLAPEILPVIVLDNDRPEAELFKATRLGAGRAFDALLAANFSQVGLSNTSQDGVTVVVAIAARIAAGIIQVRTQGIGPGGALVGDAFQATVPRDGRALLNNPAGWTASGMFTQTQDFTNPAATGNSGLIVQHSPPVAGATTDLSYLCPFVLGPRQQLWLANDTLAQFIEANFIFLERRLRPEELSR